MTYGGRKILIKIEKLMWVRMKPKQKKNQAWAGLQLMSCADDSENAARKQPDKADLSARFFASNMQ